MAVVAIDRESPTGGIVRTLWLSRPERRNALDPAHLRFLGDAFALAEEESGIRALVVSGEGSAFCAGYDLGVAFPDEAPDAPVVETMQAIRECPLPTVARVHGPAFGAGLELALSCDVRIASADATFCLPPAKLGIAYAPEGLARLAAVVGTARARLMALTGRIVDARTALDWGLVDLCVSPDELDETTSRVSNELADNAPLAVRAMKKTFNRLERTLSPEELREAESDRLACYRSADLRLGLEAFQRKTKPRFEGR